MAISHLNSSFFRTKRIQRADTSESDAPQLDTVAAARLILNSQMSWLQTDVSLVSFLLHPTLKLKPKPSSTLYVERVRAIKRSNTHSSQSSQNPALKSNATGCKLMVHPLDPSLFTGPQKLQRHLTQPCVCLSGTSCVISPTQLHSQAKNLTRFVVFWSTGGSSSPSFLFFL